VHHKRVYLVIFALARLSYLHGSHSSLASLLSQGMFSISSGTYRCRSVKGQTVPRKALAAYAAYAILINILFHHLLLSFVCYHSMCWTNSVVPARRHLFSLAVL